MILYHPAFLFNGITFFKEEYRHTTQKAKTIFSRKYQGAGLHCLKNRYIILQYETFGYSHNFCGDSRDTVFN